MSASASAQENVLLETWGQKLDLTIPSSETLSTWELDSKDKREIMMGWTCCYRKELINYAQTEHSQKLIESSLRENPRRLQYTLVEPINDFQWGAFVTLQLLDMYSTYKGLQYDCVYEANPIMGEQPSVMKMGITKAVVLYPAITSERNNRELSKQNMQDINSLMTIVILNNMSVVNRAKRNCTKRP